jgi:hypothetical protein
MTIYLLMNECGFDPAKIGFPSLQGCVGVVLQTSTGLFGWHIFGAPKIAELKRMSRQFKTFIENQPGGGTAVKLYGARFRRYRNDWREEMTTIASEIGYSGMIGCYDIGRDGSLTVNDSAYVAFTRDGAKQRCNLIYKRSSKMRYDSGTLQPGTPIGTITPDIEAKAAYAEERGKLKTFFKLTTPDEIVTANKTRDEEEQYDVTVDVGTNALSNKGVMHGVNNSNITYFNYVAG